MRLFDTPPIAAISGGVPGVFPVQVICHEVIAPDVVTLSLAQPGTTHTPGPFLPGQFITLAIPGPDGVLYRSYSLCGTSDPRAPLEITLKRVPGGMVSNYLFETVKVGMILHILPPRGTFLLSPVLHAGQTLIFVAVGSGITPIRSFLRTLAALPPGSRPAAYLHYASRSPRETIYRRELLQLDWLQQTHYLKTEGVRMTPSQIIANSSPFSRETHWYICGPEAFTFQLRDALLSAGFPDQAIHFETFTSQTRQKRAHPPAQAIVGQLAIQDTGAILDVRAQETLLEALERQGYQPVFGCRAGSCGACRLRVLRGQIHHPGTAVLTATERQEGFVLGCTAQPQGNVLIETGGIPPRSLPGGMRKVSTRRNTQKYRLRLVAAVLTCLLTAGLWQLTDHKVSASSSAGVLSPSSSRATPQHPSSPATATPATTITLPATPATGNSGNSQVVPTPTPAPIPTTITASS